MKPAGGWLWEIMVARKSVDLIEGIIQSGDTGSWATAEMEINMQMVEPQPARQWTIKVHYPSCQKMFLLLSSIRLC